MHMYEWIKAYNNDRDITLSGTQTSAVSELAGVGARGEEILDGGGGGKGGGGRRALSLFRFHLSHFPPETPNTQAISKHTARQ